MCKAIQMRTLVCELGFGDNQPIILWCNNHSNIKITKNPMFKDKAKHFKVDWHLTTQKVEDIMIKIKFAPTKDQSTKVFLIALGRKKYENPKKKLI